LPQHMLTQTVKQLHQVMGHPGKKERTAWNIAAMLPSSQAQIHYWQVQVWALPKT
jgi:hypothetical protein